MLLNLSSLIIASFCDKVFRDLSTRSGDGMGKARKRRAKLFVRHEQRRPASALNALLIPRLKLKLELKLRLELKLNRVTNASSCRESSFPFYHAVPLPALPSTFFSSFLVSPDPLGPAPPRLLFLPTLSSRLFSSLLVSLALRSSVRRQLAGAQGIRLYLTQSSVINTKRGNYVIKIEEEEEDEEE